MPSKTLSVIVSEETQRRLEQLAKLKLWSVSQTARVLIEQGLDNEGVGMEIPNTDNGKLQSQPQPVNVKELVDRLGVKLMKEGINPMRVRELAMGATKPNKREQDLLLRLSGLDELPGE